MKLKSILLLLLLNSWFGGYAQDANGLLDKAANKIQQASGIEAKFTLSVIGQGMNGSTEGMIQLNKNKFRIETREMISWFDGTTQWNYVKENDEVNVTTPTPEELNSINPYALLSLHKNGYSAHMGKQQQHQKTDIYEIVLSANNGQDLQKVVIYLKKSTLEPIYLQVVQADGLFNEIKIEHYTSNVKLKSDLFKFNAQDYPSAEIIDLR